MKNNKIDKALIIHLVNYQNGRILVRGYYKSGKESGLWEHYRENGRAWYLGEYKNGSPLGLHYDYLMS